MKYHTLWSHSNTSLHSCQTFISVLSFLCCCCFFEWMWFLLNELCGCISICHLTLFIAPSLLTWWLSYSWSHFKAISFISKAYLLKAQGAQSKYTGSIQERTPSKIKNKEAKFFKVRGVEKGDNRDPFEEVSKPLRIDLSNRSEPWTLDYLFHPIKLQEPQSSLKTLLPSNPLITLLLLSYTSFCFNTLYATSVVPNFLWWSMW